MSLALRAYAAASSVAFPFIKNRLRKTLSTGFDERCGAYRREKLDAIRGAKTFWLHAVSVGEVQAASPIVAKIGRSGWDGAMILSTVTETGAQSAGESMGDRIAAHVYAPLDVPRIVRKACEALRPMAYASMEIEVWPNLLSELRLRGVPRCLLNARISDRGWQRVSYMKSAIREAYELFDMILARSDEDARRIAAIGVSAAKIRVTGDSKIDAIIERRETASGELPLLAKRLSLGKEPVFVAGSTRKGEDEVVLRAFAGLRSGPDTKGARLIIAPRHPEMAAAIAKMASATGRVSLFSELGEGEAPEIIVVDVIGALYGLYGLATAVFVGGSLVPSGGQNILEPASWGIPILHGPYMDDFAEPTAELDAFGAAYRVERAEDIEILWRGAALGALPDSSAICTEYFASRSGAATRAWIYLERYL
ncbi:MAG: 3-deoxy-D-manno-octulosonic acid transferase [Synergistaceae bacterium]|jgi:3-deoxy-D-manno-octulosonic-acid transferase|nr:3-deoxy-D-manno-octulosonic acid transferase [Synergistaceae bacterium]